jgi:hypothetical protein
LVGALGGSLIPGIGPTGAVGVFVNWRTGSFGAFTTTGGGWGYDASVGFYGSFYSGVADLRGVNINANASTPRVTGSLHFSPAGKWVGGSLGPGSNPGLSVTVTNTKLRGCVKFGS